MHDDPRSDVLGTVAKLFVALCAFLLVWLFLLSPQWRRYQAMPNAVDQTRPTILISTSGGYGQQTLHTRSTVQSDGGLKLVFSLTVDKFEPRRGAVNLVEYLITFSNTGKEGIKCGTSEVPLPTQAFGELLLSTQRGLLQFATPQNSESRSVENPTKTNAVQQLYKASYPSMTGKLTLINDSPDGGAYEDRTTADNKRQILAESCTIPGSAIWRYADGDSNSSAERKTFLGPRIAWTSIKDKTDFQYAIDAQCKLSRTSESITEFQLAEAYPQPQVDDNSFYYASATQWARNPGEIANIGYTDQPVLMFNRRGGADREAFFICIAGVFLGAVASVCVNVASKSLDGVWRFVADRRLHGPRGDADVSA